METKGWWDHQETHRFLSIIKEENVCKLMSGSAVEKQEIYKSVHAKLVKSGYFRTIYQIKNRWRTLKVFYKKDKKKLKNSCGGIWFHLIEELLETKYPCKQAKSISVERLAVKSEATLPNTNKCDSSAGSVNENPTSTPLATGLGFTRIFSLKNKISSLPAPVEPPKRPEKEHSVASWWKAAEIKCFLEIFKKENAIQRIQNGSAKNGCVFRVIHVQMVKAGFKRTVSQLKNKWKVLKTAYIKNRKHFQNSGCETWFHILDGLLRPKPLDQNINFIGAISFPENQQRNVVEDPVEVILIDSNSDSVNELTINDGTCSTDNCATEFSPKINSCVTLPATNKVSKVIKKLEGPTGSWWNDEETHYYLNIIKKENVINALNSKTGTIPASGFKLIHAKMVNAGFNRTLPQIKNKWKSLNSIYRREKDQIVNGGKIWFPILIELLANKFSNLVENIDECESPQPCEDDDESNLNQHDLNSETISSLDESNLSHRDLNSEPISSLDESNISHRDLNSEPISSLDENLLVHPKVNSQMPTSTKFSCQGTWWSEEETSYYLNILKKENLLKAMSDSNQNRIDSYKLIHQKMLEAGFNRSLEQIRNRWKSLKVLHKKEKNQPKNFKKEWNDILNEILKAKLDKQTENVETNHTLSAQNSLSQINNGTAKSKNHHHESLTLDLRNDINVTNKKGSLDSETPSTSSGSGLMGIGTSPLKKNSTTEIKENPKLNEGNFYMEQQMKFIKEMIKEEHKFIEKMIKQHKMDTAEMLSTISSNMMNTMQKIIQTKPTINLSLGQIFPKLANPSLSTNNPLQNTKCQSLEKETNNIP